MCLRVSSSCAMRLSVIACTVLAAAANAQVVSFQAFLDGPSESPPNASPGTGIANVTMDLTAHTMRVESTFQGLTGVTTASHIHAATTTPFTGTAGVATQTPSFSGFPLGVSSGSMDTTFDMTLSSSFNAPFITNNGGTTGSAEAALFAAMSSGRAYFNIHSSTFGGGEIRGFFRIVPSAGSLSLMAMGGLCAIRRRR